MRCVVVCDKLWCLSFYTVLCFALCHVLVLCKCCILCRTHSVRQAILCTLLILICTASSFLCVFLYYYIRVSCVLNVLRVSGWTHMLVHDIVSTCVSVRRNDNGGLIQHDVFRTRCPSSKRQRRQGQQVRNAALNNPTSGSFYQCVFRYRNIVIGSLLPLLIRVVY